MGPFIRQSKQLDNLSPRDIMKARRPELFSDSERREEFVLTRAQLEYHLETLTNRKEETVFENFCRYLLKKELCPNLLPQTGPTGGGDSKVDSETYPVSEPIAALWYVGDPERSSMERWAFAFSAKKDWASKVKSDVKNVASADRGYTLIYFVTNQYVPDKKRASTEKNLQDQYGIEVRILDRTWILDAVCQNERWNIVFDTLNVGERHCKRSFGPLDTERQRDLERFEAELADETRLIRGPLYVEDCLQVALLARGLEKPCAELDGLFARAERECRKYGSQTQLFHIQYKRAWTAYFWFNDYAELSRLYDEAEPLVIDSESVWVLDNLVNLCQVGFTHARTLEHGEPEQCDIWTRRIKKLRKCLLDRYKSSDKSTAALWSRTQILFLEFLTSAPTKASTLSNLFNGLRGILQHAKSHLEYPIEPIELIVQEIGEHVSDNLEYDRLFEVITSIQSKRLGEAKQGRLRLKRGYQLLEADKRYECIDQMAKAQNLLAKEEHHDDFIAALMGTAMAYRSAELLWAARANMVVAADRALYRYVKNGQVPPPSLVSVLIELIWIELRLGRVMCALNWIELFYVLGPETQPSEHDLEKRLVIDALLSVLILRTTFDDLPHLNKAPVILENLGFSGARAALLFCLGYEEQFRDEFVPEKEDLYTFAQKCIKQPAATGIPCVANWNTSYSQKLIGSVNSFV